MKNDLVQTPQMNEDFSINIMGMLKTLNKGVWTMNKQKKVWYNKYILALFCCNCMVILVLVTISQKVENNILFLISILHIHIIA